MANGTPWNDPSAGLDWGSLFGGSVLSGQDWGMPNTGNVMPNTGDPNTGQFPWLASGGSDMFGGTNTTDWLSGMPGFDMTGSPGSSMWDSIGKWLSQPRGGMFGLDPSSIGATGLRTAPGLAALTYAGSQPGVDVGPLQGILGQLGGNQDAVVRAATDPFQQNIAAGYGDLLSSQSKRGIRGSSFGDTDIANYLDITGRGLANAGANAAQGSLSLQGDLAGNIAKLKQQQQLIKNNMYGRAFDVLGRGLNPSGYAGNINIGGGGGSGGGGSSDLGELGQIAGIGASIASIFSDRRLKSNIVKIGDDPRGWGIYEFDHFGTRQRGVMADEVERVMPEAVSEVAGLKMVDYGRLYG